eukprot:TRINITY_DN2070_c0_g1_i14.p3 TRINITY_DN2070_c0_g1~~TRINITY_DN2070_c0_g1_i14.p3  ORF type:complete len:113 (+),score=22.88 TRINITY_DN2070_c0_g1_i14:329-667(+)
MQMGMQVVVRRQIQIQIIPNTFHHKEPAPIQTAKYHTLITKAKVYHLSCATYPAPKQGGAEPIPYVVKHPMTLESCPNSKAAARGGVPQPIATDKNAVYIAPMWAAPEAKKQ